MAALHVAMMPTPLGELTIVCSPAGVVATIFDDETRDRELDRIERTLEGLSLIHI